jgi:hypothetical protein
VLKKSIVKSSVELNDKTPGSKRDPDIYTSLIVTHRHRQLLPIGNRKPCSLFLLKQRRSTRMRLLPAEYDMENQAEDRIELHKCSSPSSRHLPLL